MIELQPQLHLSTLGKPGSVSSSYYSPATATVPHEDIFSPLKFSPSEVTDDIPGPSYSKPMSIVGQYCYTFFLHHLHNPYPTLQEKQAIVDEASCSQVTLTSVSNWFTNSRRRCGWIDICNEYFKGDTKAMVEVCAHVLVNRGTKRMHDPQGVVERILSMQAKVKAWDEEQTKPSNWLVDLANLLREITLEEECKSRSASQALYASTSDPSPLPQTEVLDPESTTPPQVTANRLPESKKRRRVEDHIWEAEARGRYRCVSRTSTISTSPSEESLEPESIFSLSPSASEDDADSVEIKRLRVTNAFENEIDHTYTFKSPKTDLLELWDTPSTFAIPFDDPMAPSLEISKSWTESAFSDSALQLSNSNKRSRAQFETADFIPSKKSKLDYEYQTAIFEADIPLSINTESENASSSTSGQGKPLNNDEVAYPNPDKVDISPPDESWELDVNLFDWASFMSGFAGDNVLDMSDNTHRDEELDLSLTFLGDMMSPDINEKELRRNPTDSTDPEAGSLPLFDQHAEAGDDFPLTQGVSDSYVHCGSDVRQSKRGSQELYNSANTTEDGNTPSSQDFFSQTQVYGSEFSSESFEQVAEELRNLLSEWGSPDFIDDFESSPLGVFDTEVRS